MGEGDSPELSCASHYALNRVLSSWQTIYVPPYDGDERGPERRKTLLETSGSRDATADELLAQLGDTENYPDEAVAPY